MNVLGKVTEVISKNGSKNVLAAPSTLKYVYPQRFKELSKTKDKIKLMNKKVRDNCIRRDKKVNLSKLIEENNELVGKGSALSRKINRDQLLLLKDRKTFKRQDLLIRNDNKYDEVKASKLYMLQKDLLKDTKMASIIDQSFLNQVLPLLIKLTPLKTSEQQYKQKQDFDSNSDVIRRRFPQEIYDSVPPLLDFEEDPNCFSEYIGLLTHTKFMKDQNLPILLKTLANPSNESTAPYHTTGSYNDLLFYFKNKWDFASMREILGFMNIAHCSRDTMTYNVMISGLLKNSHIRKNKSITTEVVYYLDDMIRRQLNVDMRTWELIFKFLQTDTMRIKYLNELKMLNLPITGGMIENILKTTLRQANGPNSSLDIIRFLQENNISMNVRILQIIIESFLSQGQINSSWILLNHYQKNLLSNGKLTVGVLNSFMIYFAPRGRIDLCLLIYNRFVNDFRVVPNDLTFQQLFKALVQNGYAEKFPFVYKYLLRLRRKILGIDTRRNNYWKVKCDSIVKFNCLNTMDNYDREMNHFDKLFQLFVIPPGKNKLTWDPWNGYKKQPNIRRMLRYLNVINMGKSKNRNKNARCKSLFSDERTRRQKEEYRQRIGHIAITNAMGKRIPYGKDWYKALLDEYKNL